MLCVAVAVPLMMINDDINIVRSPNKKKLFFIKRINELIRTKPEVGRLLFFCYICHLSFESVNCSFQLTPSKRQKLTLIVSQSISI